MISEALSNVLPPTLINISNTYYDPELLIKLKYDFDDGSKQVYAGIVKTSELEEIKKGDNLMGNLIDIDHSKITGPLDNIIVIDDIKQIENFKNLPILDSSVNGRYEISSFTDFVGEFLNHTREAYLDRGLIIPDNVNVSEHTREIINAIRNFVDTLAEGYRSNKNIEFKNNVDALWYENTIDIMQFTGKRNYEKTIKDFLSLAEPPATFIDGANGDKIVQAYNVMDIINR